MRLALTILAQREWALQLKQMALLTSYLGFFFIVVFLCVFALGIELVGQVETATAIIWSAFMLSSIILMPALYEDDYRDGTLEQYYLIGRGITGFVVFKVFFYWLFALLPLLILLYPIVYFLGVDASGYVERLAMGLVLGSPTVILLNSLVASLTLGMGRHVQLLGVIIFPFLLPVLIFSISWSISGDVWVLQVLLALLLFTAPVTVWSSVYALIHALKER